MNSLMKLMTTLALATTTMIASADNTRDCVLEGTVQKGRSSSGEEVAVKFHSAEKYSQDANCRVRRGEKLEFKLPDDPRLKDAEAGSPVKYRYQRQSDGTSKTELISVGA